MTATGPAFDPARSAILRDILHETVATAPPRPSRTRFAVVAGLVGAAALLAGGTAALALSGVLHFGSPDVPPPPAPSTTLTPTPTPTPTPIPTPTSRPIAVQTTPIQRHDVDQLGAASWSLDLPGTGRSCEQRDIYDIADGLALVQLGAHVVGDGSPDCEDDLQHVSLSLVDTQRGTAIWSREWSWRAAPMYDVDVIVLGTSGRVLVADQILGDGPHEVIDLATGRTEGEFAGQKADIILNAVAVPGDSGDIVMTTPGAIVRVDPRDAQTPRWSTAISGKSSWVYPPAGESDFLPVSIQLNEPYPNGYPYEYGRIDLETGGLDSGWSINAFLNTETHPAVVSKYDASGLPVELTGLDSSGGTTWVKQLPADSDTFVVRSLTGTPGADTRYSGATDLIAVVSTSELTIIDSSSGTALWTAAATRCGLVTGAGRPAPLVTVYLDSEHDAIIVQHDGTETCTFAASTGASRPLPDVPSGSSLFFGPENTYVFSNKPTGDLVAYDRQSGAKLWSSTVYPGSWSFAGGYLVRLDGDRLTPAG